MTRSQMLTVLVSQSTSAEKSLFCWRAPDRRSESLQNRQRGRKLDTVPIDEAYDRALKFSGLLKAPASQLPTPEDPPAPIEGLSHITNVENPENMAVDASLVQDTESTSSGSNSATHKLGLLSLPSEIIHQILLQLAEISLYAVSLTCKRLHEHSLTDSLWENVLNSPDLSSPHPYLNYRSLHHALSPHLYLKRKVFIGDRRHFGSILISKYMPMTGTLEAFNLTATQLSPRFSVPWSYDPDIDIETFHPKLTLRDEPDLKISPNSKVSEDGEIPVQRRGIFATYFRAEAIHERDIYSQMAVWPSRTIPAATRVRNQSSNGFRTGPQSRQRGPFLRLPSNLSINGTAISIGGFTNINDSTGAAVDRSAFLAAPAMPKEVLDPSAKWRVEERKSKSGFLSDQAFRLRKWAILQDTNGEIDNRVRMGEMVETFAALDEELWTPTKEYPLRGIWVGDYQPHTPEFVLFHQPKVSSGKPRLEIIKLTGDPNVPRGEYSVIVDDLSAPIRIAEEDEREWPGAKVYQARGQVAETEFRNHMFMNFELIIPNAERDWKLPGDLLSKMAGKPGSGETDNGNDETAEAAQQSNDIGDGWGVGVQERRESAATSSGRKRQKKKKNQYMDEPWLQKRVALNWSPLAPEINFYWRVDIEKFLDS